MVSHPDNVFLTHSPGFEFFPGTNRAAGGVCARLGLIAAETLSVVSDTYARPTFEIYHFAPIEPPIERSGKLSSAHYSLRSWRSETDSKPLAPQAASAQ